MCTKKKNEPANSGMINTLIGNKSRIEGMLFASEATRLDGELQGKIISESTVIIGESGVVKGDIKAVEILVAGTVYGNLWAEQRIEITETGRVRGDLFTKTLVIGEGASFRGNCNMEMPDENLAIEEDREFSYPDHESVQESTKKQEEEELAWSKREGNDDNIDEMETI